MLTKFIRKHLLLWNPRKNMDLEVSFWRFPMSVATSNSTVSSSAPVLPATHGTSTVHCSTRESHSPNYAFVTRIHFLKEEECGN